MKKAICAEKLCPPTWPIGWLFPPVAMPPGWPRTLYPKQHLQVEACAGGEFVVRVLNEFDEDDDELNGELLYIRAYDGEKQIRLRQDPTGPWYDSAFFPVRNYLHRHHGIAERLSFDVERIGKRRKTLNVLFDVWGVTPRFGTGIPLKVSELK